MKLNQSNLIQNMIHKKTNGLSNFCWPCVPLGPLKGNFLLSALAYLVFLLFSSLYFCINRGTCAGIWKRGRGHNRSRSHPLRGKIAHSQGNGWKITSSCDERKEFRRWIVRNLYVTTLILATLVSCHSEELQLWLKLMIFISSFFFFWYIESHSGWDPRVIS